MTNSPPSSKSVNTPRLLLREARKHDLAAFHELYSSEEVMQHWSNPHDTLSQTEIYLDQMVTSPTNGELAFVLVLPPSTPTTISSTTPACSAIEEGIVIGHAGIWDAEWNELVFMIGPTYWKQGYMTEALAALIPIFWGKGLKSMAADVKPENEASLKLLRNCGFRQVGANIMESYLGNSESLRMELRNPNGVCGEGDAEFAFDGSDGSSRDNDLG